MFIAEVPCATGAGAVKLSPSAAARALSAAISWSSCSMSQPRLATASRLDIKPAAIASRSPWASFSGSTHICFGASHLAEV